MMAFALALGAVAALLISSVGVLLGSDTRFSRGDPEGKVAGWLTAAGGAMLVLFFPPFLNLLNCRFFIWEEVIADEYVHGLWLVALLLRWAVALRPGTFWALAAVAGLGGLIRPTLVFQVWGPWPQPCVCGWCKSETRRFQIGRETNKSWTIRPRTRRSAPCAKAWRVCRPSTQPGALSGPADTIGGL